MDFVTTNELRRESGKVWKKLERCKEIIVTRNGKLVALLISIQSENIESTSRALRWDRLDRLLTKQHANATVLGLDKLSMKEINGAAFGLNLSTIIGHKQFGSEKRTTLSLICIAPDREIPSIPCRVAPAAVAAFSL